MKNPSKSNLPAKLAHGRERFEKWRSKQKSRSRLPERLWSAAVKLAHEYGVNRTARALRLDYSSLKRRMESSVSSNLSQAVVGPKFIQLPGSELTAVAECFIECEDAKGTKIRIQFKGPLFVFRNRRATSVKILVYDGQGFWLCQKRLSKGRFPRWPNSSTAGVRTLQAHQLAVLLSGGDPNAAQGVPSWRQLGPLT